MAVMPSAEFVSSEIPKKAQNLPELYPYIGDLKSDDSELRISL